MNILCNLIRCFCVFLAAALLAANSAFAAGMTEWRVATWGDNQPSFEFQKISEPCARADTLSSSFQVLSRGNGDAELVYSVPLRADKAYRFTVWLKTANQASVDLFFRRDGFPYDSTALVTRRISGWTSVELKGIHTSPGDGAIRIGIREDNVSLCINSPHLVEIPVWEVGTPPANANIDAGFFGIHLNHLGRHNGWPDSDPGTLRLWDSGTTWANIQPENAPIDWENNASARRLDYYVRHGTSRHPGLQFIYTLGMTPTWAGTTHATRCSNSPYGPSICTKPSDLQQWRDYVRALALRYKGVIRIWELWNEADLRFHWAQTPEEMAMLASIASQELKSVDKDNQLIGPNITVGGMRFLNRFLTAGGAASIDGVSIHANPGRIPHRSFSQIRNLRRMLDDMGLERLTVWNTEPKVSCEDSSSDCTGMRAESELYLSAEDALAHALIGNAALNVKSFVYYTWEGAATDQGNVGLINESYSVSTKAGLTFGTVKMWLVNATVNHITVSHTGLNLFEVLRDGRRSLIAWSSGSNERVDLSKYRDLNRYMLASEGESRSLSGDDIAVSSDPIYLFYSPAE